MNLLHLAVRDVIFSAMAKPKSKLSTYRIRADRSRNFWGVFRYFSDLNG